MAVGIRSLDRRFHSFRTGTAAFVIALVVLLGFVAALPASPPSGTCSGYGYSTTLCAPVISASPSTVALGQAATLSTTTSFSGGTSPYTCQWLVEGVAETTYTDLGGSFSCSPGDKPSTSTGALSTLGYWNFELQVTDNLGAVVVSSPVMVDVLPSSSLTVTCAHSHVAVGSTVVCRAVVVDGGKAPAGTVSWSTSAPGSGTFSSASCRLLAYLTGSSSAPHTFFGACRVKYTSTVPGRVVLTGTYSGSSAIAQSSGTFTLTVTLKHSTTKVSCTPKSVVAGSSTTITCTAYVKGYLLTGTVDWSQTGGKGQVSLTSTSCILTVGSCSVTMTGPTAGKVKLTATYLGDSNNLGSSKAIWLTVKKAPTITSLSCTPSSFGAGSLTTCTVTVTGYGPTGTVTLSKVSGGGKIAFSSKTCTLVSGSCSVAVKGISAGSNVIKATYSGDPENKVSHNSETVIVT